jgi:predicted enzyme related to lactoylglutathione lyase
VPNPVVHFEITGADGSALQNFYRDLFDWKIDANNEWQYGVVETGGEGGIAGGIAGNQDGASGGRVSVYAAVDDLQAYLDKAERLGANVVMPVTDMGDFTIALFADPAGNITGLVNGGNQSGGD